MLSYCIVKQFLFWEHLYMVPFLKASAEINAQKSKAFVEDMKKLTLFAPVNDDKYSEIYYGATPTKAANE
jgi:hypothetical protein